LFKIKRPLPYNLQLCKVRIDVGRYISVIRQKMNYDIGQIEIMTRRNVNLAYTA